MELPETEGYNLTRSNTLLINAIVYILVFLIFMIFKKMILGAVIAFLISAVIYLFQRKISLGDIKHYLEYNKLPHVLSGNKNEIERPK